MEQEVVEDLHLEDKLEEIDISVNEDKTIQADKIQVTKLDGEVSLSSVDSLVTSSVEVSPVSERKAEIPHNILQPKKEVSCRENPRIIYTVVSY